MNYVRTVVRGNVIRVGTDPASQNVSASHHGCAVGRLTHPEPWVSRLGSGGRDGDSEG